MIGKICTHKHEGSLSGLIVGSIGGNETAQMLVICLTDGRVVYAPSYDVITQETDGVALATLPEYPQITDEAAIEAASRETAKLYTFMESQRVKILEIEAHIAAKQEEIARTIRGQYADLYRSQEIAAGVYEKHKERLRLGGLAVWNSKGRPVKGKTWGAVQIKQTRQLAHYDPAKALAYCKTQAPALVIESVNDSKFKAACKDGVFMPPDDVIRFEETESVAIIESTLKGYSGGG